jgi:hypothetical protein
MATTTPDGNSNDSSKKQQQQSPAEALAAARARVEKSVADRTTPKKPTRVTVSKITYTDGLNYANNRCFGVWLLSGLAVFCFVATFIVLADTGFDPKKEKLCDLIVYDYDANEHAYVDVFPVLSGKREVDSSGPAWYSYRKHAMRIYSKFSTPPKIGSASPNGKISCYGEIPNAFGACYISSPSEKPVWAVFWSLLGTLLLLVALGLAINVAMIYDYHPKEYQRVLNILADRDNFLRNFDHVPRTATWGEISTFLRDPSVVAAAEAKCDAEQQ